MNSNAPSLHLYIYWLISRGGGCLCVCVPKQLVKISKTHENEWEPIRGKFVQLNEQHQGGCFLLSLYFPLLLCLENSLPLSFCSHRTLKVMKPHNWICILPATLLMENLPFSFSLISFERWQCHCDYQREITHTDTHMLMLISCFWHSHTQHISVCFSLNVFTCPAFASHFHLFYSFALLHYRSLLFSLLYCTRMW